MEETPLDKPDDEEWDDLLLRVRREEELAQHRRSLGTFGIIFPQIIKTSFHIVLGLAVLYLIAVLLIPWIFGGLYNMD